MYFHSLQKFHRNSTWNNSIYQETVLMIIFHVFLRLVTNPKARSRREYDWDHESMDLGTPGRR